MSLKSVRDFDLHFLIESHGERMRSYSIPPLFLKDSVSKETHSKPHLIAQSKSMKHLLHTLQHYAHSTLPALILGETGSGKELCAHEIHRISPQARGPFIAVNCAAIPPSILMSELFGCVEGAFTGARARPGLIASAHKGTLFLDEIGELPLDAQATLLRALEYQEFRAVGSDYIKRVRFRLIAATHQDLNQAIKKGRFREDLYHRISTLTLHIPPLRKRVDDLGQLVQSLNPDLYDRLHLSAWASLRHYQWPGNVRELKNTLDQLQLQYPQGPIYAYHLPFTPPTPPTLHDALKESSSHILGHFLSLKEHQRLYIEYIHTHYEGDLDAMSHLLQLSRASLYRHLSKPLPDVNLPLAQTMSSTSVSRKKSA